MANVKEIIEKAGKIKEVSDIDPWKQLRGEFKIFAETGVILVYFALNPEQNPKVQNLYLSLEPN